MFTAAIRIERNAERQVGRLIAAENGFGLLLDDLGLPGQSMAGFSGCIISRISLGRDLARVAVRPAIVDIFRINTS